MTHKLILLSGPSGSGKGTLCAYIRKTYPHLMSPTSWTTRRPRQSDLDGTSGKKYRFVSEAEFKAQVERGGFLEWASYGGNFYGTPKEEVRELLKQGHVFQELEVQGAAQVLATVPREQVTLVFVTAESWETLRGRILAREAMSEDELELRKERYEKEIDFSKNANHVLLNAEGKLAETEAALDRIVASSIK